MHRFVLLRMGTCVGLSLVLVTFLGVNISYANVVIVDTFDDADRDNDGTSDEGNENPVGVNNGIGWYGINGLTGDGAKQKPNLTIADDSGGIDSGNALNVEAVGANGEFIGAFDQNYLLGAAVGSQLKVSFDIRFTDLFLPSSAEFRFGIYGDTDNQFGTSAVNTDGSPTEWGTTDGNFDAESPGAVGDTGVYARVQLGESLSLDGSQTRIADEHNVNNILGGSGDSDLIDIAGLGEEGESLFGVINDDGKHSFELSLERVAPSATGETVMVSLSLTDSDDITTVLSGLDGDSSATDNLATGDTFRYIVGATTADADYRIDNFQLEIVEPSVLPGDFNGDGTVDAADYTVWRDNEGDLDEVALGGAGDGLNGIDSADYDLWVVNYGTSSSTASSTAVPEPSGLLLIGCCAMASAVRYRKS